MTEKSGNIFKNNENTSTGSENSIDFLFKIIAVNRDHL